MSRPASLDNRRDRRPPRGSQTRAAPARTKMWSWLVWELPARCETAAKKLETQSDLLGAAFKTGADAAAPPGPAPAPPAASPQ